MRQMTLLEIVQDVMSDMDSDEVNSISDTIESMQVANIARSVYESIIDGKDWPHLYTLFQLTASSNNLLPTHLSIPTAAVELGWFKYNKKKSTDTKDKFEQVKYKTPEDFITLLNQRDSSATNVDSVVDTSGVTLYVLNDTAPTYFTSFNNDTIVCDSYDSDVDTTLQTTKTQAFGKVLPTFTLSDSYIPDLPSQAFAYYVNEVKAAASLKLKQVPDQKAEQHSLTGKRRMSQEAWKVQKGIQYPDYGRRRMK